MRNRIRNALAAVALVLAGAFGSNLLGAVKATEAQAIGDEVMLLAAANGVWIYTRRDGIEYCYLETSRIRCLRR